MSVTFTGLRSNTAIMVPQGGTGVSNIPQGGVLIGQGTDAINAVVGAEGEVLTFISGTWVGAQPTGGNGGGGGLSTVNTTGNIQGDGSAGSPVALKASISLTAVTASFSGSGAGLTNIPNNALQNNSITIDGTVVPLGGNYISPQTPSGFSVDGTIITFYSASAGIVAGNVVALSGNLVRADFSDNLRSNAIGIVTSVDGTTVTVKLAGEESIISGSAITGVGTPVYVGATGSVIPYSGITSGKYITQVGYISPNSGKIIIQPRVFGQLA